MSFVCKAQSKKNIDSLFLINDYLHDIKSTSNNKLSGEIQYARIDELIKKGTQHNQILQRNLKVILSNNKQKYSDLNNRFRMILQSAILLKTDLKNSNFVLPKNNSEQIYLSKNIPILIDEINKINAIAKQKIDAKQR